MNSKIRPIFLAVGFVFFCYLVSTLGIANILENIVKTGWWFIPIIVAWGFVYLLNATSWRIIMGDNLNGINFAQIFRITLSSFALNYVTPLMSLGGEPFRVMSVRGKIGTERAVSSVFLYRLLHSIGHLLFLLIAVIIGAIFIPAAARYRFYLIFISAILLILISLLLSAQRRDIFSAFLKFVRRMPLLSGIAKTLGAREDSAIDIDSKIRELYLSRRTAFISVIFLELVSRFIGSLEFFFILHAIDIKIPLQDAFYLSAASSLALTLLFFIPYELGTREGSLYLLMASLHLNPAVGIYIGLANRIREIFWISVGLGFIYVSDRRLKCRAPVVEVSQEDVHILEKKA